MLVFGKCPPRFLALDVCIHNSSGSANLSQAPVYSFIDRGSIYASSDLCNQYLVHFQHLKMSHTPLYRSLAFSMKFVSFATASASEESAPASAPASLTAQAYSLHQRQQIREDGVPTVPSLAVA